MDSDIKFVQTVVISSLSKVVFVILYAHVPIILK